MEGNDITARSQVLLLILIAASGGCASAAPRPQEGVEHPPEIDSLLQRQKALREQLQASSPELQNRCTISDGDCSLVKADKRTRVARAGEFPECFGIGGADQVRACEDRSALAAGKGKAVQDYYAWENWCTEQILACTERVKSERVTLAASGLADERRGQIATLPDGNELDLEVEFAEERVRYLRGTLPIADERMCRDLAAARSCREQLVGAQETLEQALRAPEGEYRLQDAQALYREFRKQEARCYQPEYECIRQELTQYGASGTGAQSIDENLKWVRQRQSLLREVPVEAGDACVGEGAQRYQDLVMDRFERYAAAPTAKNRQQLEQTFLMVHKAQVTCLRKAQR